MSKVVPYLQVHTTSYDSNCSCSKASKFKLAGSPPLKACQCLSLNGLATVNKQST